MVATETQVIKTLALFGKFIYNNAYIKVYVDHKLLSFELQCIL